jgi:hypothetical protein
LVNSLSQNRDRLLHSWSLSYVGSFNVALFISEIITERTTHEEALNYEQKKIQIQCKEATDKEIKNKEKRRLRKQKLK